MACVCARARVCVRLEWNTLNWMDKGCCAEARDAQALCLLQLQTYACMHAKKKCMRCRGTALFSYTWIGKSTFVLHLFDFCSHFLFFKKKKQCTLPAVSQPFTDWLWFMNRMTWPGPLCKMGADEGVSEVRWAVGELLLQRSHHVWRLCPDNSVAASSHENFPGGRGCCATQPQYLMKNLSEVAIRACYIR